MSTTTAPRTVCAAPPNVRPITGYRTYKCRCYRCSNAANTYDRVRQKAIQNNTWQPLVDATPTLAHLDRLREAGLGCRRIARAAGLNRATVVRYLSDTSRPRPQQIHPEFAEALLAVTVSSAVAAGGRVPSLGSRRRAHALAAVGWPLTAQAEQLGVQVGDYAHSLDRPQLSAGRAEAIAALYERLSGTPGPSSRARAFAKSRGWAPPLAWDDIDDPDETPSVYARGEVCGNGHSYDDGNRYRDPSNGRTRCRVCTNAARARSVKRAKASSTAPAGAPTEGKAA